MQLREIAPDLPFIPVIQGYTRDEYLACTDLYERARIDLTTQPLVGLGSVCRRQATEEAHGIIRALHAGGITRLHGFGVKTLGLERYGHLLQFGRLPGLVLRRTPQAAPGLRIDQAQELRQLSDLRTRVAGATLLAPADRPAPIARTGRRRTA